MMYVVVFLCALTTLAVVTVVSSSSSDSGGRATTTRVFSLQTDIWAAPRSDAFVRYNLTGERRPPSSFTVCYRYNIQQFRDGVYFLSYSTADHMDNAMLFYQREETMNFYYDDVEASVDMYLPIDDTMGSWHHHCHLISFPDYRLYVDGVLTGEGKMVGQNRPIQMNGTIYIGQEQDSFAGGLDRLQSTSAFMAQINVWDTLVSEAEIKAMASCSENLFGNILSTDVHKVEVVNVGEEERAISSLCRATEEFVLIPEKWHLEPSKTFCSVSNSEVFIPSGDESNEELFQETRNFLGQCGGKSYRLLRLGATDRKTDGDWRKFHNDEVLSYTAWAPGEPNDGLKSDCIVLKKSLSKWGDVDCKDEYCFSCLKDKKRFLQIRGLCQQKEHHTRFILDGYVNERPFFRGYYGHSVFMAEDQQWLLRDGLANRTLAVMEKRRSLTTEYPLGRHEWKVISPFCQNFVDDTVEISLSSCATDEFTCADGFCVPGSVRCNLLDDCPDKSDEDNCDLLGFPVGYHGHRPPPGVTTQEPLMIEPTINIIRFSNIDDISLAIYMELEVVLAWTDRNLEYRNLKEKAENKLSKAEVKKVWLPEVEFLNVNDGRLKVLKESLFVRAVDKPEPPHFNDVKMDTVFAATSGQMVQSILYSASFSCNFQLFRYPFDTQTCSVFFELTSATSLVVAFQNASVQYHGMAALSKYMVGSMTSIVYDNNGNSAVQATFQLERRYSLLVLTIFLPTVLLLGIGYSTLFVKLALLQVRAIMTLTTLLVLYTLFNQVSSALPDTAYIKMIDLWFFFCISLIFSVIILHILVENLTPGEPPLAAKKVMTVAPLVASAGRIGERLRNKVTAYVLITSVRKFVYPLILFVFNLFFWVMLFAY